MSYLWFKSGVFLPDLHDDDPRSSRVTFPVVTIRTSLSTPAVTFPLPLEPGRSQVVYENPSTSSACDVETSSSWREGEMSEGEGGDVQVTALSLVITLPLAVPAVSAAGVYCVPTASCSPSRVSVPSIPLFS